MFSRHVRIYKSVCTLDTGCFRLFKLNMIPHKNVVYIYTQSCWLCISIIWETSLKKVVRCYRNRMPYRGTLFGIEMPVLWDVIILTCRKIILLHSQNGYLPTQFILFFLWHLHFFRFISLFSFIALSFVSRFSFCFFYPLLFHTLISSSSPSSPHTPVSVFHKSVSFLSLFRRFMCLGPTFTLRSIVSCCCLCQYGAYTLHFLQ
jgi:hypothetical protein